VITNSAGRDALSFSSIAVKVTEKFVPIPAPAGISMSTSTSSSFSPERVTSGVDPETCNVLCSG
jgi:hypothetical protein